MQIQLSTPKNLYKTKNSLLGAGGYLLSPLRSIIDTIRLNFSVRNGKRCDPYVKPPTLNNEFIYDKFFRISNCGLQIS